MAASRIAMSLLLLVGIGFFAWTALRRWRLMNAALAHADRTDHLGHRIRNVIVYMFGQARMFRYPAAGLMHAFIFLGFVVLGLRTMILVARGFTDDPQFGFWLFDDDAILGRAYLFIKDIFSLLVIVGVSYFLVQRLIVRSKRMTLSGEGVFILCMILGLMFADLTYEATAPFANKEIVRELSNHDTYNATIHFPPGAAIWSNILSFLPATALHALHHIGFWAHTIIVLAFLNFLPYGKHFHIITVLPNVLTSNTEKIGLIRGIPDIEGKLEREETLGVKTVQNFNWKDVLDFYTCTECGRCSDMCPAFNTGKKLSPKQFSIDLRDHMYANEDVLIKLPQKPANAANVGDSDAAQADAAAIANDDSGSFSIKDDEKFQLLGNVIDPEVIWACTTCGACEQECPVFISYVDKIVAMRQHAAMESGEFPDQLQNAFRGLETVGNPYSFANEQRADWAAGLEIPLRSAKPDAEYLYWVGCSPSFDDRARKIARSMARLMKHAGVDFAILGPEEMCTGDPARRSGNEYLFEILAKQNIETLNSYNVTKIVTTCPHCFNTIGREYPELDGKFTLIHHTDFLHQLVQSGKLKPTNPINAKIAYHDSCYIGRYHEIYDPPREILKAIPGVELVEPNETRSRGMCCGAGGAQMWKEEEPVVRPESKHGNGKVNHARVRQILNVLPNNPDDAKVASACPFCKTMLSDGLVDQGHEAVEQKDVAEYLAMSVLGPEQPAQA
ncbi:MAG: (Fe-S)-binding protein [Phycisphaerae bacterium]